MSRNKRELDSELNLISFVSLLSVLICSLLLTAIWVHIGSMDVKQAVGGQTQSADKKTPPSVWANLRPDGSIRFYLEDFPRTARKLQNRRIKGVEGKINENAVEEYIASLRNLVPDLRTALIQPKSEVLYEDIMNLLDNFKEQGLVDLGVVPL